MPVHAPPASASARTFPRRSGRRTRCGRTSQACSTSQPEPLDLVSLHHYGSLTEHDERENLGAGEQPGGAALSNPLHPCRTKPGLHWRTGQHGADASRRPGSRIRPGGDRRDRDGRRLAGRGLGMAPSAGPDPRRREPPRPSAADRRIQRQVFGTLIPRPVWPKACCHRSLGQRPRNWGKIRTFGQRPYSPTKPERQIWPCTIPAEGRHWACPVEATMDG